MADGGVKHEIITMTVKLFCIYFVRVLINLLLFEGYALCALFPSLPSFIHRVAGEDNYPGLKLNALQRGPVY